MKRSLIFVLVLTLAATVFAAAPMAAADSEQVTLSFISHIYKPWNDLLTQQAQEFMDANPNIKIEYTTVERADLNIKLMTALAAGDAPEIMGIYGPWMPELVSNGWLNPAPDYVKEDIEQNTFPVAGQSAEYDGEIYGYIQHIGIAAPIINKDMYDGAGLEYPKTYEDLLAAADVLNIIDNDIVMQAAAAFPNVKDGSWNVIDWCAILRSYGGKLLNEDNTAAAFNSPQGAQATEIYKQLSYPGFASDDNFVQGFSGMEWSGPWSRASYVENNPDLNFTALEPLSGPEGQVATMYAWFWCVAQSATDAEKEAAWKFLSYISSDEKYMEMAKTVDFISFRTANYEDESYVNDEWIQAFQAALECAEIYYAKITDWEKIDVAIGTELERMTAGEISVEEMLANAETQVNEILSAG